MNTPRPTPETDAEIKTTDYLTGEPVVVADFARKLERERDEAREEIENLKALAIHTCHSDCKRPLCVANRKIKAMREAIKEAHGALKAIDDLHIRDFPSGGEFSDTAIEAFNRGNVALIKLQPFIKP